MCITIIVLSLAIGILSQQNRLETCKTTPLKGTAFCNSTLEKPERIASILSILSIDEKISLLHHENPAITRLNITKMGWGNEALHGIIRAGTHVLTSFPQVLNLGRTWDIENIHLMAQKIGDEGRAATNLDLADGSFWSPNLNVYRDPRWGRGQETPGEDPKLIEDYAQAFISGLIGDQKFHKVQSCAKHYTAYDLENWPFHEVEKDENEPIVGIDRHHFNAIVTKQDMEETYQPPFMAAVKAGVPCIMCSYNSVNGVPACGNPYLLQDQLRDTFGFKGHVVTDCGAIHDIYANHQYVRTPEEAVKVGLTAGSDLDCGSIYSDYGKSAMDKGLITEKDVDLALGRIFESRINLGEFDPWEDQPYRKLGEESINTKENQDLAYKLAQESMVLLKNDGALPLDPTKINKIAVIGPSGKDPQNLQGIYSCKYPPYLITPYDGIKTYVDDVMFSVGCDFQYPVEFILEAVETAKKADVVVLTVGLSHELESESRDRNYLYWPGYQEHLIRSVVYSVDVPTILVAVGGGQIDVSWEKENMNAVIFAGYPSQSGGQALADVLFGKYNPTGKLTYTVYPEKYADQCNMTDMTMRPSDECPDGRTYKFYTGEAIYKFGDGMSYTQFEFMWEDDEDEIRVSRKDLEAQKTTTVKVNVKNVGEGDGGIVVIGFITNTFNDDAPIKQMFGYEFLRYLPVGEIGRAELTLESKDFEYVDKNGKRIVENGVYTIQVENVIKNVVVY